MSENQDRKSGSCLKSLIIALIIIAALIGGGVFLVKCYYKKYVDNDANTDGNPVLLNRAATVNDFQFEQSVEATLTSLKDSYILIPNTDIKNLKLTLKYYDSSNKVVCTHTSELGNVYKSQSYTISISHSFTDLFKISKYQCTVSGGTVSYFA